MKNWKIEEKKNCFEQNLLKKYNPIILKILENRGIRESEEIEKFFNFNYDKDLSDPFLIFGMKEAVERIIRAKEKKEKIAIFGDYDADGVSASALIYETLSELGFSDIICYIPDRQLEGYGMNKKAIEYLFQEKINLIITVDSGITNEKEIKMAKNFGIDVIITDHHHAPKFLPEAYSIINPNIQDSGFVFKELAGVGVAFKLAEALYKKIEPNKIEKLKWSLDLVALGTIADCVPLISENRIFVKYGLIVLSKTRRVGFQEIFKVGRIDISENNIPNTQKVAFQIAPRINAAGRMDHANISYNILIEKNTVLARNMALEVESKNKERQKLTAEIFKNVRVLAENSFKDKKIIFAESPHWPVGILGLVAGKITEDFQKTTAIFQRQENEFVGSFRSIPEVNIIKNIEKCSEFLIKFGGHSQAAGVSLKLENMENFYKKISSLIEKDLEGKEIVPSIKIDCELTVEEINWELMEEMKKMEPFGAGNEEPVFLARNMIVSDLRIVGNGNKHWKFSLRSQSASPKIFDAIGFSMAQKFPEIKKDDKIDIVFNLQEDSWNGSKKIQLRIIDLKINGKYEA